MTLKGGYVSVEMLGKDELMVPGGYVIGNALFVPFNPTVDKQFTLRISFTGGMAYPCDMRVIVGDQARGFRPVFDLEPHAVLELFVTPTHGQEKVVVIACPITHRRDDQPQADTIMSHQGPVQYRGIRVHPVRPDWIEEPVNPELLVVVFMRK